MFEQIIVCLIVLVNSVMSADYGTQCTPTTCPNERGYIVYNGLPSISGSRWTIRAPNNQFTTFVLHLKNIQNADTRSEWLRIYQSNYLYPRTHNINGIQNRLFIWEETNKVSISVQRNSYFQFELHYFVGCAVKEGSNITITKLPFQPKQPLHYNLLGEFQAPGVQAPGYNIPLIYTTPAATSKCWVVVPSIVKEIKTQRSYLENLYASLGIAYPGNNMKRYLDVKETILGLQNVSALPDVAVQVSDLINGKTVLSGKGIEVGDFSTLEKSNSTIKYKTSQKISTILLVDLFCPNEKTCSQAHFKFTATALQQSDLDCIEKEQKCRFNIGKKNFTNCNPPAVPPLLTLVTKTVDDLSHSDCPAINSALASIPANLDVIESHVSGKDLATVAQHCVDYTKYCSLGCSGFPGCQKMCLIVKHYLKLCRYFQPSVFA